MKKFKFLVALLLTVFSLSFVACTDGTKQEDPTDQKQEFTVTFNTNGGSSVASVTVKEGEKISKPANPSKTGYTFVAWYKDAAFTTEWKFETDVVTANTTLYAKFDPIPVKQEFTVTFIVDDQTYKTVTVKDGEPCTQPAAPEKTSYTFNGWYKESTLENRWNFAEEAVTANTTLYAKFTRNDVTIAEAIALCEEAGYVSEERYVITATVESIDHPTYGQMTISDSTGSISVYGSYSADGETRYGDMDADQKPYAGDTVVLSCILQNFNGKKEVKSAWILSYTHNEPDIDENDYQTMTVRQARSAQKGTLVRLTGVVAQITYADGQIPIPSGFYLVDGTDSIYVYDSQVAARVAIGNQVTVLGAKTYWILESEAASAQKYGYEGCCQIEKAYLKENDNGNHAFDKSWITSKTIKDILETPLTTNITTTIYKVNALVSKEVGKGFVNYYFYDLDGTTGSYTYTQCSGEDFAWLDEFDGKICTVYLSVINAKSSASGCIYRFLPILVEDENYQISADYIPEFVVKYHALDQFKTVYTGDPYLEVVTSVSSTLLGFENVSLTYRSSDEGVAYFETENDKLLMRLKDYGSVTVTVTATYNDKTYSLPIQITYQQPENISSLTVAEAIATALDTEVTVKGIVGPSLVNKVGFYLVDESGIIAVTVSDEVMDGLKLGQEVVIKGNRTVTTKTSGEVTNSGQSYIEVTQLLQNNEGRTNYSTATFIQTTFDAVYETAIVNEGKNNWDVTDQAYIFEAKLTVVDSAWSTNFYLNGTDGKKIQLYAGNGKTQYGWLMDYADKTIKVEFALCNWNVANMKGSLLSIVLPSGEKVVNQLNFTYKR